MNDLTNKAVHKAQDDTVLVKGYDVKPVQATATYDQENFPPSRLVANAVKPVQATQVAKILAAPCKRTNIFKDSSSEHDQKAVLIPQARLEYGFDLPLGNGRPSQEAICGDQGEAAMDPEGLNNQVQVKCEASIDFHEDYLRMVEGGLTCDGSISADDGACQARNWEVEVEDEYISYHSISNTITGGVGISGDIFPIFTDDIREEIEEAGELVAASQTHEDIEEELWDTSMVAEYGQEIFEFLRQQDVSFSFIYHQSITYLS